MLEATGYLDSFDQDSLGEKFRVHGSTQSLLFELCSSTAPGGAQRMICITGN